MGIKGLNSFLRKTCGRNIRQVSLYELKGKVIAIDASIYMYRFKCDGGLIDGIYQMTSLFKHCGIVPLFVFDGKPPSVKNGALQKRQTLKKCAENRHYELTKMLNEEGIIEDRANDIEDEIRTLSKKIVRITYDDIENVKVLISLMGVSYYECDGEADAICARMVHDNIAYACMSEDMDLFVYGTANVLRYLSLLNSVVVIYDLNGILETLEVSFKEFQDICIVAGTDYSLPATVETDINYSLKMFSTYRESGEKCNYSDWIKNNSDIDAQSLNCTINLFDISEIKIIQEQLIKTKYNDTGIKQFLERYGFVFV
jgi:flap endonuclease-1